MIQVRAHETTATYRSYKCKLKPRRKATYNRFQAPCVLWIDSPVEICLRDANTCQTAFSLISVSEYSRHDNSQYADKPTNQ